MMFLRLRKGLKGEGGDDRKPGVVNGSLHSGASPPRCASLVHVVSHAVAKAYFGAERSSRSDSIRPDSIQRAFARAGCISTRFHSFLRGDRIKIGISLKMRPSAQRKKGFEPTCRVVYRMKEE